MEQNNLIDILTKQDEINFDQLVEKYLSLRENLSMSESIKELVRLVSKYTISQRENIEDNIAKEYATGMIGLGEYDEKKWHHADATLFNTIVKAVKYGLQNKSLPDELRNAADERGVLMKAISDIRNLFEKRTWIMEGRGSYLYYDDRYKEEVRNLYDEFDVVIKNVFLNIKSKTFEYKERILKENSDPKYLQLKKDLKEIYENHKKSFNNVKENRARYQEEKWTDAEISLCDKWIQSLAFILSDINKILTK